MRDGERTLPTPSPCRMAGGVGAMPTRIAGDKDGLVENVVMIGYLFKGPQFVSQYRNSLQQLFLSRGSTKRYRCGDCRRGLSQLMTELGVGGGGQPYDTRETHTRDQREQCSYFIDVGAGSGCFSTFIARPLWTGLGQRVNLQSAVFPARHWRQCGFGSHSNISGSSAPGRKSPGSSRPLQKNGQ